VGVAVLNHGLDCFMPHRCAAPLRPESNQSDSGQVRLLNPSHQPHTFHMGHVTLLEEPMWFTMQIRTPCFTNKHTSQTNTYTNSTCKQIKGRFHKSLQKMEIRFLLNSITWPSLTQDELKICVPGYLPQFNDSGAYLHHISTLVFLAASTELKALLKFGWVEDFLLP